uniref:Chemotaxis protein CheX n=1 Tax=Geobacter metallireducens TaxID=28232 RepID=A0A831XLH1_GEOME
MTGITFEEIMFTIMSATQDTFKNYLGVDIYAGKVEKKVDPVDSDVVGIVGVAGDRVGYIILGADSGAAVTIAKQLLMLDEPDEESIRDAIGELTNNIAGVFKTRYHEQYGSVALGLPLVVSGSIRTMGEGEPDPAAPSSMNVQCKGVTIPFRSLDGTFSLRVMVYM